MRWLLWLVVAGASGAPTDARTGLSADPQCETLRGGSHPGATGYYVGRLDVNGESVTGEETWVLFANSAWRAKGAGDCQITWAVRGRTAPPRNCPGCSVAVILDASIDFANSNCIEGLTQSVVNRAKHQTFFYNVQTAANGVMTVSYESGKVLGTGHPAEGQIAYTTASACEWW